MKSCCCYGMWSFYSGIGLELYDAHLEKVSTILNIYGPYVNRMSFWKTVLSKDFVTNREVILGGMPRFADLGRSRVLWQPFLLIPLHKKICWI